MHRDERTMAEQFDRDLDALLDARDRGAEPRSPSYERDLELARELVDLDLAPQGSAREALRRRLLAAHPRPRRRGALPRALVHGTLAAFGATMLLLVFVGPALWLWPENAFTFRERLYEALARVVDRGTRMEESLGIEVMVPGEELRVVKPAPNQVLLVRRELAPMTFAANHLRTWSITTPVGTFGGYLSGDERVRHARSIEEAQGMVPFVLRRPTYLPPGYALREAAISPLDSAHLSYEGPAGDIVVVELPLNRTFEHSNSPGRHAGIAWTTVTDKPVQWAEVAQRKASWIEGHGLFWEDDGMSYLVGGPSLSLEETRRIAVSLE